MNHFKFIFVSCCFWALSVAATAEEKKAADTADGLTITWERNYLVIKGDFPGEGIPILYLEAYCRPGSTDRDWGESVIPHQAELLEASDDRRVIKIRDQLEDGVIVEHVITAKQDEVDFQLVAHNPTDKVSP